MNPVNSYPKPKFNNNLIPTCLIIFFFTIFIILKIIVLGICLYALSLLSQLRLQPSEELKSTLLNLLNSLVQFNSYSPGLFIICATIFLYWLYQANQNVRYIGINDLEFTPGWAVGSFFIPILSLYWPYKVIKEMWKGTFSDSPNTWKQQTTPAMIGIWWLCFLISIFGNSLVQNNKINGPQEFFNYLAYTSIFQFFSIVSAALITLIVFRIYKQQNNKKLALDNLAQII